MNQEPPSRFVRLKRLQFSLHTMLIVTTVLILLLVFWVIPSERQRNAARHIEEQGGKWDFYGSNPTIFGSSTADHSRFAFNFKDIEFVSIKNAESIPWSDIPNLKRLALVDCKITRVDAIRIGQLSKLNTLQLIRCEITDDDLHAAIRSPLLKELSIIKQQSTSTSTFARDLRQINAIHPGWVSELQHLEKLSLEFCLIDDEIFNQIVSLKNLTYLDLDSTNLREIDTRSFDKLLKLKTLNLANSYLSSSSLEHVVKLPKLERLDLSNFHLGIEELSILAKSKNLQRLICYDDFEPDFADNVIKIPNLKLLKLNGSQHRFRRDDLPDPYEKLKNEILDRSSTIEIILPNHRESRDFLDDN